MSEQAEPGSTGTDFTALADEHRAELHAHCYRMLGSVYDADDALQETLLRAWRGAAGLRDGAAARSWLYTIATNVCLTEIGRRGRRALPHDVSPAAEPGTAPGRPLVESTWIEPYPDQFFGVGGGRAGPEATYEQREGLELAFVAALQHLAAPQRAALILRDVLGFTARETADILATSVASVNSALARARTGVAARVPERSQQATLRALGDAGLRALVDRYVEAWERCDVDAFTALVVEDVSFAMPPMSTWYTPRTTVESWAREWPLSGYYRWKAVRTQANAQQALAFYGKRDGDAAYLPFAINVLTLRGGLVSDVTAFVAGDTETTHGAFSDSFERFGLPDHLD